MIALVDATGSDPGRRWHVRCYEEFKVTIIHSKAAGGDEMKKLSIVKLEKRIAPRYVPFGR
jgi:hypothetical protein